MDSNAWSAIFAGLSFLAAAAAIWWQVREHKHRYLLDQAILSLERVYNILTDGWEPGALIPADRLGWLACARHIARYKKLKAELESELHRIVCEEHEEHWRHKFHLCLHTQVIHDAAYYAENGREGKAGIDPVSAVIVHSFATWPEGTPDPIDAVDVKSLLKDANCLDRNIGLRFYLESFPKYQNIRERLK